ncbi:MAG: hypothetical protein Q7U53_17265 [Anaerolineaceae bacterium]|nr:hypothetical protein [Anaerolineaceae bacterium]
MEYYHLHEPNYSSDYEAVIRNGFAYTNEASGYHDLIKKGYPLPLNPKTILAEIYSIHVPSILWATLTNIWDCAFLVTDKLLNEFKTFNFSGYETVPVEIAKVATKGNKRKGRTEYSDEPEDLIYNRKNLLNEIEYLPTLWGISITAGFELKPKYNNSPEVIQPFVLATDPTMDLFYTTYNIRPYGKQIFCSERFYSFLKDNQIENFEGDLCSEIFLDTKLFY